MKKLRLLFTQDCNRNCPGCCNKQWDLDKLKNVSHYNYDEILLTGGEPLLYTQELKGVIKAIKSVSKAKVYLYTAVSHKESIYDVLPLLDGITLTLHDKNDFHGLKWLLYIINKNPEDFKNKSLHLNVFKGIDLSDLDLYGWKVKDNVEWIDNCPLPEDEEFLRI